MTNYSLNQTNFSKGTLPSPVLDGLYKGSVSFHKFSWLGKKFDSKTNSGINIFDIGNGQTKEKYPFKTSFSKSLDDGNLDVLALDYNLPENPFYLRFILDEVVQITPGKYLGKLYIKITPSFTIPIIYFNLDK